MPRTAARGRRWVSIEVDKRDYEVLKEAARRDQRSLTVFLRIALGELASEIEFKSLERDKAEQSKVEGK